MMYARLMYIKWKPGTDLDAMSKIYRDSVLPAAKEQKGFVAATFIHNEDNPLASLSVTVWKRKEDALAGESSGYLQAQVDKLKEFLAAPPERKGGDVGLYSSN